MKRIISLALLAALLCLPACGAPKPQQEPTPLTFKTGFQINTRGGREDLSYTAQIVRSKRSLDAYYKNDQDANKEAYLSALKKYDRAFFRDKVLLLITKAEDSSSNSLQMLDLSLPAKKDQLEVRMLHILPKAAADNTALWVIAVELDKNAIPKSRSFPVTVQFIDYDRKG